MEPFVDVGGDRDDGGEGDSTEAAIVVGLRAVAGGWRGKREGRLRERGAGCWVSLTWLARREARRRSWMTLPRRRRQLDKELLHRCLSPGASYTEILRSPSLSRIISPSATNSRLRTTSPTTPSFWRGALLSCIMGRDLKRSSFECDSTSRRVSLDVAGEGGPTRLGRRGVGRGEEGEMGAVRKEKARSVWVSVLRGVPEEVDDARSLAGISPPSSHCRVVVLFSLRFTPPPLPPLHSPPPLPSPPIPVPSTPPLPPTHPPAAATAPALSATSSNSLRSPSHARRTSRASRAASTRMRCARTMCWAGETAPALLFAARAARSSAISAGRSVWRAVCLFCLFFFWSVLVSGVGEKKGGGWVGCVVDGVGWIGLDWIGLGSR
jgi:hypothetical protein